MNKIIKKQSVDNGDKIIENGFKILTLWWCEPTKMESRFHSDDALMPKVVEELHQNTTTPTSTLRALSSARTLFNAKPLSVASKRERWVFPLTRDQTWVASRLNPVYELGWDTQFRGPKFLPNSLTRLTWQFYCCVVNVLLRFQKWFPVRKITVWPFFFPEFCMTFFRKRCAYPAYRRSI